MSIFEYPELVFTQFALLIISGIWLLRRNDEIPLLISSFLFYMASYRYWAVTSGIDKWVNLGSFGFRAITKEAALIALSYIVLGQMCLLGTYMVQQRRVLPIAILSCDSSLLRWLRPKVIFLGLSCLPLVVITRSNVIEQIASGRSLAFQISGYLRLFPFVLVGVATLIVCLWKFGGFSSLFSKLAAFVILASLANLTFSSSGRFQFLGWIVASGIIISSSYRPKVRLAVLSSIAIVGISIFALAGAMRNPQLTSDILNQAAWERAFSAEDANMLDGFVLIQEVYPQRLDFRWGMEHLEILLRPIPRALWPDKPVGGYMNQLGLITANTGFTLGISPTLFGSFFAEAGIIGVFLCSSVYGVILATIVRYTTKLQPFASILIRAIVCASLIPLLRGGDLPGIYAWIGMAFWPCFLLLWFKRTNFRLKSSSFIQAYDSTYE
ncbi:MULTISPECIES: hypothetical protein [unclassified Coleofasciculus]|uniref:hypothetical protein n=1 Tax=unclassified Coleofasciculus TaxID=2692782 RepID=UPI001882A60E|nr:MULTISPECIES: hypothetical protein [unclassified Coleofasciculus]MBE9125722.1 hypothetical protein [Coleofasciculus sp. LEGE 07081]MBE9147210.1 hypothetical protein [Coleofasciculus sp. LEGE 07092]